MDSLTLLRGNPVSRRPKIGYVLSDRHITRAWEKLRERRITVTEFLAEASNFVSNLACNLDFADVDANDEDDRELIEAVIVPDEPLPVDPQHIALPAAPEVRPIPAIPNDPAPYVPGKNYVLAKLV